MCECRTKIQFEIDGGSLYQIKELENNECLTFSECLYCTEIEENLEDGTYNATLICKVYPVRYAEGIEYDGENIVENIINIKQ